MTKCFFLGHKWRSRLLQRFNGVFTENYSIQPRDFWENTCERCGKVLTWTWQMEKA